MHNNFVKNHGRVRKDSCELFNEIILRAAKLHDILPRVILQFIERCTRVKFRICQIGGSVFITRICGCFANCVICETTGKYAAMYCRGRYVKGAIWTVFAQKYFPRCQRILFHSNSSSSTLTGIPESYFNLPLCTRSVWQSGPNLNNAKCLRSVYVHARDTL